MKFTLAILTITLVASAQLGECSVLSLGSLLKSAIAGVTNITSDVATSVEEIVESVGSTASNLTASLTTTISELTNTTIAIAVKSEDETMKNLTTVTWAHAVNNKTYLDAALASDVSMLEADIVLGHINGQDGPPIPVMAHPPATTSDISLATFLSTVAQYNNVNAKQKGVKLDFKSIEAFEKSQDLIATYSKPQINFPLWLNADILPGPVAATTKPVDPAKFLHLGSKHPRAVLSVGWTTNYGGNTTEGEYSGEQIGTMLRMINEHHINQTVTFAVRAGLAANSQPVMLDLLRETSSLNSSMTVWSHEGDHVVVDRLRALILTVGLERTYLDVPQSLAAKLHLPPPSTNVKN